jgi:UDP-N-acetylmuramate dehydrogenase
MRSATFALPTSPDLKVLQDSPMSLHTTWRIGGPAQYLVRAPHQAAIEAALEWAAAEGLPVTVIGGGSNLLAPDSGIPGLVILSRTPGERAEHLVDWEDRGDHVWFSVGAQAPLSWTGRFASEHGWAGLDWGVGLPGTIGGATVNNAGAHGTEMKDHLETVTVLRDGREIETHPRSWLEPAYRHTTIKASPRPREHVVLRVTMLLPKGDRTELVALADDHAEFRLRTQPKGACGGSTLPIRRGILRASCSKRADSKAFPSVRSGSRPCTAISSSTAAAVPPHRYAS